MYKIVVLYKHPSDPEHFRAHYEKVHLPLASKLPGLIASRHGFEIKGHAETPFAIWEGEFADQQSADSAMRSDVGQSVLADTANYAQAGFNVFEYAVQEDFS